MSKVKNSPPPLVVQAGDPAAEEPGGAGAAGHHTLLVCGVSDRRRGSGSVLELGLVVVLQSREKVGACV